MKSKRVLLLLVMIVALPGGLLLLLPFAARIFGGVAAGLRGLLLAFGIVSWIAYQSVSPKDPQGEFGLNQ